MNLLPWLLDWPPSPGTIVFVLLMTALSAGTLVAFGGVVNEADQENVTIEATDVSVRLNDDEGGFPEGENGTVRTCLGSGTPGDSISVLVDVTVTVPAEERRGVGEERRLTVVVSLAHTEEHTADTVTGTGRATSDVFWLLDHDETLSVGDTATLQVRVREEGSTVASATRPVTVENGSRSHDC